MKLAELQGVVKAAAGNNSIAELESLIASVSGEKGKSIS